MFYFMNKYKKDPKRVAAGKKAYKTRLRHERDKSIVEAAASTIPGYGQISHLAKAVEYQRKIDINRRKSVRKRK